MSVVSSAAGQGRRVGRRVRKNRHRGERDLIELIEEGWQFFWRQRRQAPPAVVKLQVLGHFYPTEGWR